MSIVRSCVRSVVRSPVRGVFGGDDVFGPASLFSSGAQGAWYDPSDFSTLFQNSTGTTPVTAVEQPVRLMLDRSRGLVLGSEATKGAWTQVVATATISGEDVSLSGGAGFPAAGRSITGLTVGNYYLATINVTAVSGNQSFEYRNSATPGGGSRVVAVPFSTTGTKSLFFKAEAGNNIEVRGDGGSPTVSFTSLSVRELPGNHALAPNDASRPVLRARYNQLTFSEQFDNAGWGKVRISATANTHVAPDGTTTADTITANTAGAGATQINQDITFAGARTFSVYAKAGSHDFIQLINAGDAQAFANFNINTGTIGTVGTKTTASIENAGSGWYRCSASFDATIVVNQSHRIYFVPNNVSAQAAAFTSSGTDTILLWGAQLLSAADQTSTGGAYQRVAAATDYDVSNPVWRPYLAFDGSDDSLSTSAIDFSGTDEMTVFAGVSKLSDVATALLAEFSASVTANNGSFYVAAPGSNGATDIVFIPKGTTAASVTATGIAAPSTSVVTGLSDISAPASTIRINGAQVAQNTATQGTGNFGNHPLFIGRRNNTSFPFNGRLYSLAVLGRTATAAEIGAMEAWVAGKTGVTL